jgi:hypothetical protein
MDKCVGHSPLIEAKYFHIDSQVDEIRHIRAGFQTKKSYQPELDLWIPLIFWFTKDSESSLPILKTKTLQKYINLIPCSLAKLLKAYDPLDNEIPLPFNELGMISCEMYLNNLFVDPRIAEIYMNDIGFNIIRQFKHTRLQLSKATDKKILKDFPHVIESMRMGFRPTVNENDFEDWYRFTKVANNSITIPAVISNPPNPPLLVYRSMTYKTETLPVSIFSLKIDNAYLFEELPYELINTFTPHMAQIQGKNGKQMYPSDKGLSLVSFSRKIGERNPTGYLNAARIKEFFISWENADISLAQPVELYISATIINFLIVDGKNATIRFID